MLLISGILSNASLTNCFMLRWEIKQLLSEEVILILKAGPPHCEILVKSAVGSTSRACQHSSGSLGTG